MRSVEVSAKTREEAIKIALEQLGVDRDEAHVEILDEGSSGIFGFGARPVKLRVATEVAGPPPRREHPKGQPKEKPAHATKASGSPKGARHENKPKPAPKPTAAPSRPASGVDAVADGEAAALLNEIIRRMGIEATVTSQATEDGGLCLKVDSPDSAILIGRKGRNLSSMQYLINRMVHTGEGSEDVERIVIDIEGYLDRRQEALEDLAHRLAQRAKETRRRVRVKPMSAQERRVIHMTLEDDPDVKTFSVGDALVRSVVIAPANEEEESPQRPPRHRSGSHRGSRGGREREGGRAESTAPANGDQPRRNSSRRRHRGRRRPSGQPSSTPEQVPAQAEMAQGESSDD